MDSLNEHSIRNSRTLAAAVGMEQRGSWLRPSGGQVFSMLAFYSDDPSSNPAEAYIFFLKKLCLNRRKNKQKEAEVGPFFKKRFLIRILPIDGLQNVS